MREYIEGWLGFTKTIVQPDAEKQAAEMLTFQARCYRHLELQVSREPGRGRSAVSCQLGSSSIASV